MRVAQGEQPSANRIGDDVLDHPERADKESADLDGWPLPARDNRHADNDQERDERTGLQQPL